MESGEKRFSLALVRQRYTPFGGAERFLERAMTTLLKQNVAITLLARHWDGETSGYTTRRCDPFFLGRLWRDLSFSRCAQRAWQLENYHIVQSHERIPGCDLYRAGDGVHLEWLKQKSRIQNGWERFMTSLSPYHRYLLAAEKKLFHHPRLKAVICNSNMVKEEIHHWFGLSREKLHVIYSGIDSNTFCPGLRDQYLEMMRNRWNIPQNCVLFLFVGSGFERKGLQSLLESLRQVPSAWLLVVGKQRNAKKFVEMSRQLGLDQRVVFAGGQNAAEMFYGAADAVVLPTLYDPFPNVALEAMATGLPLVTSFKCGAADLIVHGQNGFLVDALDTEGMAHYLTLLLDVNLRRSVGASGRETVRPLTLERMGQQLLSLYSELLVEDDLSRSA